MRITYNHEYPERIRIAFIGCGGHALRNVFPTFQYAPVDLIAVCDLDQTRAEAAGRLFGARTVYTDYKAMLAQEDLDAVFVVTNYDEQGKPRYPALAMAIMEAGAHAWIEKPPASSVAEIEAMHQVSQRTGKFVFVGIKKIFFPAIVKAKEIISQPEFGQITSLTARYPQRLPPLTERGDGLKMRGFLDHIVHPYSIIHYLGGPVESIFVQWNAVTLASVTAIRFTSGAVGSLHLSAGQSGMSPLERTEVVGEGANVIVENNLRVTYYRPGRPPAGYGRESTYYGSETEAPLSWEPEFSLGQLYNKGIFMLGYAPEVLYFCDCVLQNRPPEKGNLDDALALMKIYEAYCQPDRQVVQVTPA